MPVHAIFCAIGIPVLISNDIQGESKLSSYIEFSQNKEPGYSMDKMFESIYFIFFHAFNLLAKKQKKPSFVRIANIFKLAISWSASTCHGHLSIHMNSALIILS